MKTKRVFLIVLDSFGVGELPDAAKYGDCGSDTFDAVSRSEYLDVPNMRSLGLFNIDGVSPKGAVESPRGAFGRAAERSAGKDTTTGHWEIAGVVSEKPMPTFPDGFPQYAIDEFSRLTGRGVLCNKPYSGTEVIKATSPIRARKSFSTTAGSIWRPGTSSSIPPRTASFR